MNNGMLQLIGGPTCLIEVGGFRILTDPTFDPPGEYPIGNRSLTKLKGPAFSVDSLGKVDAVLLSHDQHPDNLDRLGRTVLEKVPVILTTPAGSKRVPGSTGMHPWEEYSLASANGGNILVTAVPAQHGPDGTEHLTGPVAGFVITGKGVPTTYVSGDNASLQKVREIASRFPEIDLAILFAGAARTPLIGNQKLTLGSDDAAEASKILNAKVIVPAHYDGWKHFSEGADDLVREFNGRGLSDRLHLLEGGQKIPI